jgi:hypothetical protein
MKRNSQESSKLPRTADKYAAFHIEKTQDNPPRAKMQIMLTFHFDSTFIFVTTDKGIASKMTSLIAKMMQKTSVSRKRSRQCPPVAA